MVQKVAVDSIGPWYIEVGGTRSQANTYEFRALTCIDTVSNLAELIRQERVTAAANCNLIDQAWMCQYPWPKRVIHDGGPEFKNEFQTHMKNTESRRRKLHRTILKPMRFASVCI